MAITPRSFLRNPLLLIGLIFALAIPAAVLAMTFTCSQRAPAPERVIVKRVMVPVASVPTQQRVAPETNERGWLGVRITTLNSQHAARLGVASNTRGVLVEQVLDGMPAQRAGFQGGDIITHYSGERVVTACNFKSRVGATDPQSHVRIRVLRNGAPLILSPVLTAAPDCGCKR